jgi:transcriptional regulator with XRE-family HTH domain
MTFAKRLLTLRKDRALTQEKIGKVIGVGKTSISNYERGYSTPDPETIVVLANYFEVTTDYLLGRDVLDSKSIDPYKLGRMAEVKQLADEIMEKFSLALADGDLTKDQAMLCLKLFRQNLDVMMEEANKK